MVPILRSNAGGRNTRSGDAVLWWARKAEKSRAAVGTDGNFFAIRKVLVVCLQRVIKR
jgi:hypothetical protein